MIRQNVSKIVHLEIINEMAEKGKYKNVGLIYNDVKKDISSYGYGYTGYTYYGNTDK